MRAHDDSKVPGGGVQNWGVPNWLDATQYPKHAGPSAGAAWSWEFLRRAPAYRDFWTKEVFPFVERDGSIDFDASVGRYRSANADGDEEVWGVFREARDRYGLLTGPHDPRSTRPPPLMDGNAIREIRFSEQLIKLSRREVGYVFDLGRPLKPQFDRALEAARGLQAHRRKTGQIEVELARLRAAKFVRYLRLIDAEDARVAPKKIKDALFQDIAKDYPDDARAGAFKDARRVAHRLRDGGWRALSTT
jgi:hypothetical protein